MSLDGDEWPYMPYRHAGPFFVLGVMARGAREGEDRTERK
jgi:hypothetical protein